MATRPNIGIHVAGTGPTKESIDALAEAIVYVLQTGNDREERLAALDVLGKGSTGGVSINNSDIRMNEEQS